MQAAGFGWCRDCRHWLKTITIRNGRCAEHRRAAERRRYATDDGYRFYRKNMVSKRRRGVEAVPPEGIEALIERCGTGCVYCGKPADTIDHMEPVSRGGRTTPGNVVLACKSCNSRKKDMPFDDWLDKLQAEGAQLSEALREALEFSAGSFYG